MKILQFDDDEMLANMYAVMLRRLGFEYVGAEHPPTKKPEDLVNYVLEVNPDLIMMDIIMPVMDGFTAINILKSSDKTRHIPIFVFSNLGQNEDVKRAFDLGANDYFIAAHNIPSELTQRIKDYLDNPKKYKSTLIEQAYKLPLFFKFEGTIVKAEENKDESVSTFVFDESLNDWRSIPFGNFVEASEWGKKIENPKLPKKI